MFTIILDNNAANVAFPFIERSFPETPRSTLAWVSTGFSIMAAALLLVSGRLADRSGRRRIFLTGMTVFAVASALTAIAPTPALLIAARLVQGAGSALLSATAVALLLSEFPPAKRGLALGIWGTVASAGAAAGPTLGALAIEASSWRLVFLLNVPIAVVVLTFGRAILRQDRPEGTSGTLDLFGTATGTLGVAALTLSLLQGPRWGWTSPAVVGSAVACVVLLTIFFGWCHRSADPLLDLTLFNDRRFATANLSQAGTQMAIFVWFFTTPLFLINVWHYSALAGGTAVAIGMIASFVSMPVGHWSDRHGYRRVLIAGGLVSVAGMTWWVLKVEAEAELLDGVSSRPSPVRRRRRNGRHRGHQCGPGRDAGLLAGQRQRRLSDDPPAGRRDRCRCRGCTPWRPRLRFAHGLPHNLALDRRRLPVLGRGHPRLPR